MGQGGTQAGTGHALRNFCILTVRDLAVSRGGRLVLAGASFAVGPGDLVAVTGRNGAGKSSLLRALAGFLPPARGSIAWTGPDRAPAPLPLGESLHYLGHRNGLKAALTAGQNLVFQAALAGGSGMEPEAALARVGLAHLLDVPAGHLSSGQQRRVALARLLVSHRPLWLLDEPATAIDADAQATLSGLMAEHLGSGGAIVAATHAPLGLSAHELRLES